MHNSNDILKLISMYYPKNLSYDIPEYKASKEFLNNVKKREEIKEDDQFTMYLCSSAKKIFSKYEVENWTDVVSFNCYELRVLLHKNQPILDDDVELMKCLGEKRIDLFLFISVLGKYYYFFVNETIYDESNGEWKFEKVFDYPKKIKREIEKLQVFFAVEGYYKISNSLAHMAIDDIETELIEKGRVKVFNFLFTDIISI